ncbi:hypothetical protein Golax_001005, partial [Gossypium laxum]|nr:hypothetical protein [Gossypium laxum]
KLAWSIGDDANIRCWKDSWIPDIDLLNTHIPYYANLDMNCTLKDLFKHYSTWNLDLFRKWLSDDVINHIVSIPPLYSNSGSDRIRLVQPQIHFLHGIEDIIHVLWDCPTTKEVWRHVIPTEHHQRFFSDNFQSEMEVVCWAQQFDFHQSGYKANTLNPIHSSRDKSLWVQLYTDEAVARDMGNSSAGGLLRDQFGN